jgi:hypothetical protein
LSRTVNGEVLELQFSGKNYNNMTLLQDASEKTLWLPATGMAVIGKEHGEVLDMENFEVMSWEAFKENYPQGHATSETIYFPLYETPDSLALKWMVDGFVDQGEAIAFSREIFKGFGADTFELAGNSYAAFYDVDRDETFVYKLDEDRTFNYDFDGFVITDVETGSEWGTDGRVLSGELEGLQLERMQTQEMFWFCWYSLYPDSVIAQFETEVDSEEVTE